MRRVVRFLPFLAVIAVFVAIRCIQWDADPPPTMPNGRLTTELIAEPIAKAHEARNYALFGSFSTHPVDNYQFWRAQSPVWVYPLSLAFKLFGPQTNTLGAFALVGSTLGYIAFLHFARLRLKGVAWVAAALFLGLNFYQILYSRVGLLEFQVMGLVTLSAIFVVRAEKHPLQIIPALIAFFAAFFTKQSALFFSPVVLVAFLVAQKAVWSAHYRTAFYRLAPVAVAVLLLTGAFFIMRTPDYQRALAWNFGHVVIGETQHSEINFERVPLLQVLIRPLWWRRWSEGFYLLFPIAGPLALIRSISLLPALVRRQIRRWEAVTLGTFICALGSTLYAKPEGSRFEMILFVPVSLLAADALSLLGRATTHGGFKWGRWAVLTALTGALSFDGFHFARWVTTATYQVATVRSEIDDAIVTNPARWAGGPEQPAVAIGLWAGPAVFNTRHYYYYTKENFNTTKEAMAALQPTHLFLLDVADPTRRFMKLHFTNRFDRLAVRRIWPTPRGDLTMFVVDGPLP
ncbi:MAG: hypothetical protein IPK82_42060 [Polyangiaceae bacterium]|nr:hypothetical protein [Polyangiaceae bacterium]